MSAWSDLQMAIRTGNAELIADAQIAYNAECQKEAWEDAHRYDICDEADEDEEDDEGDE